MPRSSASRRTQFSSCDACHRSRVACDASKMGHQPGQTRSGGSCSRCLSKKRDCTFKWIKTPVARSRTDSVSGSASSTAGSSVSCETATRNKAPKRRAETANEDHSRSTRALLSDISFLEIPPDLNSTSSSDANGVDILLSQWSDQIFNHVFGTLFGQLTGRNGCPLVHDPTSDLYVTPIRLFTELDKYMDKQSLCSGDAALARREERNYQIKQSLRRTVQSFTARWLPLVMQGGSDVSIQYEEIIINRWRASRRDMLKVINRISYRSVLTLYLFAQTPVPLGISEEEEMDGVSGSVCSQTALLQLQQLRGRMHHLNSSRVSTSGGVTRSGTNANFSQTFLDLETRAYWAAVVWDTSNSLTSDIRSSLTSGLKGACLEPAWRLVRAFLVGSFHARSEDWRMKSVEISDDIASQIISAAAICTIYTWRTIASVKEALREGVEENDLLFSWNAVLDTFDVFKTTLQPLLASCQRRLHFLGQVERLSWYQVVLHYHLGMMILVDAIDDAGRSDLLLQITNKRLESEQEAFNVLKFGLESRYTISGPQGATERPVIGSFVAIDPNPQYVIAVVQWMKKCFHRRYQGGNITEEVHSRLSSTLLAVLEQLPESSKVSSYASRMALC